MTRKNKTKGKKAKNGETSSKKSIPSQEEPQVLPRNDSFRGFTEATELHYAERHFNEEKRDGYVAPGYRPKLPMAPECATLDENQKVDLGTEIEKLTYPIPSRSVTFAAYMEYRKQVEMHGTKTNEQLISIMNWDLEWIEAADEYIHNMESIVYRGYPKEDPDYIAMEDLRKNRRVYMALRERNHLEEDLKKTMRYMENYLVKQDVEDNLTEPYRESVAKYLFDHPAENQWMLSFTRCIYFSDYTRLVPILFSSPTVHYQSILISKYGYNVDKELVDETDMIRYERDQKLIQLSICRRWLVARMIASRPKYLLGGMERYLGAEPNVQRALKLKLAFELIESDGLEPSADLLSRQLRELVFSSFKAETGIDYSDIFIVPEDTLEDIQRKEQLKDSLIQRFDSVTMTRALDVLTKIKRAYLKAENKKLMETT